MKTLFYFTDGSLDQVSDDLAARHFQSGEARLATRAEARLYLRCIAQDDAQALSVADRIDGYDRDNLGESSDY